MASYYQTFTKQASATLDYKVDWGSPDNACGGPWLETGDTIATSTWTVPLGITQDDVTFDDTTATIIISGGTAHTTYELMNTIVTANGLSDFRTLKISVV